MRKRVLVVIAVSSALLLSASMALAADGWIGTWKLDIAKSKYGSGPAPKSQTLKFEATATGTKLVSDAVDAEGKAIHTEFVSKFDGQDVAWSGNPNADTASPKRIDNSSYENVWKKGGKVTITSEAVVSKDGKTLTLTYTGTDANGQAVNRTYVYDRQ